MGGSFQVRGQSQVMGANMRPGRSGVKRKPRSEGVIADKCLGLIEERLQAMRDEGHVEHVQKVEGDVQIERQISAEDPTSRAISRAEVGDRGEEGVGARCRGEGGSGEGPVAGDK